MSNNEKTSQSLSGFLSTEDEEEISVSSRIILYMVALFIISFVIWANFAALDEVTRGQGKVIPSSQMQALQSLEGGIVEEFLVEEGDSVEAGQVLMRLRSVQASSDYAAQNARYMSLQAKAARLRAEAEGLDEPVFSPGLIQNVRASVAEEMEGFLANRKNLASRLNVLEEQLTQSRQRLKELHVQIRDLKEIIALSREEKEMIEPLVKRGSAPQVELLQLERALKVKESELNGVQGSVPRARSATQEIEARLQEIKDTIRAEAQTELSATTIEINTIAETLSALEDRKVRTEIRSPVAGIVQDMKVNTVGGVVGPGEDLIEIVPRDDQLIIEAQIRPRDIAFLHPQQKAIVKITAYDYSIYGGLKGSLVDISADTITNERGETFYRVKIRTDETSLMRKDEILPIIPGMVASVDILTGKKTVMQYLLKPLIKTLDNAMIER